LLCLDFLGTYSSKRMRIKLSCYSDDGNRRCCDADTRNGVDLVGQRGTARCERGYSWDYDARGVWVDHGCQAEFQLH
jgi:hypothetical protein